MKKETKELVDYLNSKSEEIHKHNVSVGWWDGDQDCIRTKIQLVSTEIAEASEGVRKGIMDDKLPHRKMEEVELADALIRMLDIGGRLNFKINELNEDFTLDVTPLARHWQINSILFYPHYSTGEWSWYEDVISIILRVAKDNGFDIIAAMEEKLEFNKTRPDHKKENREKEGGKKW